MIYYSLLLVYIFVLYSAAKHMKNKEHGRSLFFIFVCLAVILFQGFRSFSVGTDLISYIPSYSRVGGTGFSDLSYSNYEAGYVVLNKILYRLGLDERGFLIVVAAIIQIPIFLTIYRYSEEPLISILWYFSFGNFLMTFSGLRQSIAMSICFMAYRFIKEQKVVWYCIVILFASFFHTSALFCLVLYPTYYVKINKQKLVGMIGMFMLIFVFRRRIFAFMSLLYYGEAKMTTSTGAYSMFAVYALLFIISFFKKKPDIDYKGLRNILLVLTMIYSFASLHDYVTRIGYPLAFYMTLFVPKLISVFKVTPRKIYYGACYAMLLFSFYYFLGGLDTLPFKFG